jgi:hypothetical protein
MKKWTEDEIWQLSLDERLALYNNAKKHPDGQSIIDVFENCGIPLSAGGLTLDNPVYLEMIKIAWSKEGKAAAIAATAAGIPALCGVDRLLQKELGVRYHKHDLGTASAGSLVAEVMRHLGYREIGSAACPSDCVARTGLLWAK